MSKKYMNQTTVLSAFQAKLVAPGQAGLIARSDHKVTNVIANRHQKVIVAAQPSSLFYTHTHTTAVSGLLNTIHY